MKKKTLFALLLAAVMLLSGCSLVLKDSAVDAKQTIIDVNGEQVDKQTFLNAYNYTLTMQQYYAQMLQQFGGDGTVDEASILQSTLDNYISSLVLSQKAKELGFDQFTDAELAELQAQAQEEYDTQLESIRTTYFADSELEGDALTAEVTAYAKANDGKLNYASLGQGNVLYLTVRKLESELGIRMTEVPYKGSAPSLTALMANDVQFYVDVLPGALPFIQSGKLKALAVPGDKRIPWLPDVPTLQEAGYNKFHAVSWLGWAVPSATPPEVVSKLQEAIGRFAQNENFRATFTKAGVLMLPAMTPAQVDDYLRADRERWGALIREHNISIDQ